MQKSVAGEENGVSRGRNSKCKGLEIRIPRQGQGREIRHM